MTKKFVIVSLILAVFLIPAPKTSAQTENPPQAPTEEKAAAPAASADFDSAMKHYRQKHYAQAIEEFGKIVEADPKNAAAYYFMGYAHYVMGHYEESLAAFKKTFEADPRFDPRPYWHR